MARDAPKSSKGEAASAAAAPEKPRFDFYKILPGAEEPKIGKAERAPAVARVEPPKTVEVHLSSAYRKLGITSRGELAALWPPDAVG